MRPEQPDTPVTESEPPVADELPVAKLVRPPRPPRDPAQVAREAARLRRVVRVCLLSVAAVLTTIFVLAFRIYPYDEDGNPRTMATHTQLGMPPCNFVVLTGKPCPSCGMSTSFALLVRGDVTASLRANWVGSLICVTWALTLLWSVASAIRGKLLFIRRGRGEMVFTAILGVIVGLMLLRWGVILVSG